MTTTRKRLGTIGVVSGNVMVGDPSHFIGADAIILESIPDREELGNVLNDADGEPVVFETPKYRNLGLSVPADTGGLAVWLEIDDETERRRLVVDLD